VGWRWTFVVFAGLGVAWVFFFSRWFCDNPGDHPKVNAVEVELLREASQNIDAHGSIPWKKLVTCRSVLLLWLYYFCISYVWYFYITWMPTYMGEALKMDMKSPLTAVLGGAPLFLGGIGCFVGGIAARKLAAKNLEGGISRPRRWVGVIGMLCAGGFIALATQQSNPMLVMLAMGVSGFFNDLSMPGAWGACSDIGGKFAGSVSGSMNMMGNFGGALAPVAVVWILDAAGNDWNVPLYVAAATYLVSALCWAFIDSDDRLHD
jgi:nitrate/nitrite transporter NarK